jgi:protein-S-isoprenylcysteine O-methyltransferase Ste14
MNKDNANVIAWPPLMFAVCAGIGIIAHFVHAVPITGEIFIRWLGGVLAVCSAALAIWAKRVMQAAGTNVRPDQPTLVIVKRGPYRHTRNPMYLSLCVFQIGIALLFNDWIALLLALVLFTILHFGVVLREEAYLERKFGEEYLELKHSVRRWI